ncbi:heparan-alpha-glucosaminide N-acetyltransferase domain-containing protein [Granulicella sp. dw_53]|uniref:DUF1624 domain-containing protein n=1 Tax=Granulicella sp. dw_53 TaxID=2719792 RepID=UPI001BD26712|nr:heparan-alpha-glucosaminide N-acetyltransferase domain-containing protein [Granulicella sp. dw_53]
MNSTATTYISESPLRPNRVAPQDRPIQVKKPVERIPSVDVLRGFAMILMALNHTQIFFFSGEHAMPALLNSNLPLFFTRWTPGFCAPVFVFLAGVAAYLQLQRGKTKAELSRFLFTRGLWLILLEVTIINYGAFFALTLPVLQVFWALGISMVMLAGLVWLPMPIIAVIGITFVAGHNAFDHVRAASLGSWANLWRLLHETGLLLFAGKPIAFVAYPAIPWNGLMILGFCFGEIIILPAVRRIRITAISGACLLILFLGLRGLHAYGDPTQWNASTDVATSIKTFLGVSHNPVSLQFCAMAIGVSLLFLAWLDSLLVAGRSSWLRKYVEVYGGVPLFYYLLHIYALHALSIILCALTGHDWHVLAAPLPQRMKMHLPDGYGFGLPGVYLIWIAVVTALYWPVRQYANYKRAHPEKTWLSYL